MRKANDFILVSKQTPDALGSWKQLALKFRTTCGFTGFSDEDVFRLVVTKGGSLTPRILEICVNSRRAN